MYERIIVTKQSIERLRQRARKIKRSEGLRHYEALDIVAKSAGFNHWHHVSEHAKLFQDTERAYYFGCVIAMDAKNAFDTTGSMLIEDNDLAFLCSNDILEETLNTIDELDPKGRTFRETEDSAQTKEIHDNDMLELIFYRHQHTSPPSLLVDALKLVEKESFWRPEYIWLNGEFYNTSPWVDQ